MLHNALCFDAATTVVSSLNRIIAIQNKLNENRKTNANGKNTFLKILFYVEISHFIKFSKLSVHLYFSDPCRQKNVFHA